MVGASSTDGKEKMGKEFRGESWNDESIWVTNIDRRIILKRIFKKQCARVCTGPYYSLGTTRTVPRAYDILGPWRNGREKIQIKELRNMKM
jgi:hypothetical protein